MKVTKASFISSSVNLAGCPKPEKPEYVFTGRSNVGKSSLINMLTGIRELARTSSVPGKTQLINHFLINEEWYLVDLPGLGYAKTARHKRKEWKLKIFQYLLHRRNLLHIFFLVDIRLDPQTIDLDFITWMGQNKLPFTILFTKTDKLSKLNVEKNLKKYLQILEHNWEELPPMIQTSSKTVAGKTEILEFIHKTNKIFHE